MQRSREHVTDEEKQLSPYGPGKFSAQSFQSQYYTTCHRQQSTVLKNFRNRLYPLAVQKPVITMGSDKFSEPQTEGP